MRSRPPASRRPSKQDDQPTGVDTGRVTFAEPVVAVHRGRDRFVTRTPGLTSRHGFSFGQHYDPARTSFGPLLASNEDLVVSGRGYDAHPHRDTEIITWVLSGSLVHIDSAGHRGVIHPGLAQRMSAGSGIVHSERNDAYAGEPTRPEAPRAPVHFVQMWLRPDQPGGPPSYAQREVPLADLDQHWVPIASGGHPEAAVTLAARGCTLWAGRLSTGGRRRLPPGDRVYLQVVRGAVDLEAAGVLAGGDAAQLVGAPGLRITAVVDAELLVWTLPR